MTITLDDLRGDSPAICGDFNKIREEVIRDAGENQNEVEKLLTQRILMEFVQFHVEKRKRKQYLEKKRKQYLEKPLEKKKMVALRIIGPKKPLELTPNNPGNINQNQEEEGKSRKLKKQRKKPMEKKKRVVLRIISLKKPLESASNNSGNINQNQEKEEEEGKASRKPKRQRKNPTEMKQAAVPDQPLPTEFRDKIIELQGSDIKLVIQKELTITDMEGSQDRLSIPRGQMRYNFLSREEQVRLEKKEANGIHFKGLEVPLIEPSLEVSSIFLKKWKLGSSSSYMLSKPWINVAERNKLKSTNTIQLWSFRVNQKPHLALVKLEN